MSKYILLLSFLFFISCEPRVVFQKAMPPNTASIYQFPDTFTGAYVCESDSSRIYIFDHLAIHESHYRFVTTIDKVSETENCSVLAGGLYLPGREECVPFTYLTADTIMATIYNIDTLFAFRFHEVAKLYKGHLFLNQMDKQRNWITWMLTPDQSDGLYFKLVNVPEGLNSIEDISTSHETRTTKKDETQYILDPTLIEFDKILAEGYVRTCDYLKAISLENEISKFRL